MSVLSIIVSGTTYDLDDGVNFECTQFSGWGVAPLHRLTERGPLQHGETGIGFRLDPRVGQVKIRTIAASPSDWFARHDTLMTIFRPTDGVLKLRYTRADGAQRQIDCHYIDGLFPDSEASNGCDEFVPVQFVAHDPTWYDPAMNSATWTLAIQTELSFPISFPISFGTNNLSGMTSITYAGNWLAYPTLYLTGPLTNTTVVNTATGDKIELVYTIPAGDMVTIDLAYGAKTVTDNHGVNLIGYLSDDSDMATFSIVPAPDAPGGVNILTAYAGGAISGQSEIELDWYDRYLGV